MGVLETASFLLPFTGEGARRADGGKLLLYRHHNPSTFAGFHVIF